MKIIGINGFKRSGKGETALAVRRILIPDVAVKSVGFADKLKILGARTLGFVDFSDAQCIALMDEAKESWQISVEKRANDLDLDPYSPYHMTYRQPVTQLTGRQYLQHLGNQARNVFGESFWVDQVLPDPHEEGALMQMALEERYPGVDVLCITDLRYENEARRIRALGGVIWEVLRPGTGSDGHASEQPLPGDLVDWNIYNSGDLNDLEVEVNNAIMETLN